MDTKDNFPERIDFLINKLNGPSEFARKTGVTLSTIARWRKGEAEPSRPNLVKIAEVADVTIQWLATGEQPTYQGLVQRAFERLEEEKAENEGIEKLPFFESIKVSAGFGSFNEGVTKPDSYTTYATSLIQELGVKTRDCGVFKASGNSMEPTISNTDQILVDFSKKEVQSDKIYLVQNGDSVWVKRVKMLWDGVELISDNKSEYAPIKISREDAENLQIIGQVVHVGHKLI